MILIAAFLAATAGPVRAQDIESAFGNPPEASRPWVYWYWMNAAVSKPGITADLQAMKAAGIGGAYLMPIKGPADPPYLTPPATQLSPVFWSDVRFAFAEADRLGIKLAMHACDGWSIGGGPWITPERSMQWVTWSETQVGGGRRLELALPRPPSNEGYYRDIAVYAYPSPPGAGVSTRTVKPIVTSSEPGPAPGFLADPPREDPGPYGQFLGQGAELFTSGGACWIRYAFAEPFTCRSLTVLGVGNATAWANRFVLQASDDGTHFRDVARISPPRHGWEDWDAGVTHAIPAVTARFFRFVYDLQGGEPGAEDLDSAKWTPVLKLRGIVLSSEARLDGFEGKSGAVWRVSPPTSGAQVAAADCIAPRRLVDLSTRMDASGRLSWDAPPGNWTLLRMGATSTGHLNETGGGARGLECDKFDPAAARLQFDRWFGEAVRQAGPELASRVLKIFHVDSWECGSQNWSPVFRDEFRHRRGYDPLPYLPAMAGVPIASPDVSERFLRDVRETIAELVVDGFYKPLERLAAEHGCQFSAESVAPTFVSDGMAHFREATLPQGEFWLRSPTHDKLSDILDASSGAHIYGRPLAQAESFTELHNLWDETPALIKPLGDRNWCFGINRFILHVFVHNPWLDRRPGMTLGPVGTFFQRDQTWWASGGAAWIDYARRCQALLQLGSPAADVAVFTGDQAPRRAVVPWQLEATLPGLVPPRPAGPIIEAGDWVDPLHGYAYDSINRDALLRLARVRGGRIELPGGASYAVLVVPAAYPMNPEPQRLTPEVAARLESLAEAGATVILGARPAASPSLSGFPGCDGDVARAAAALWPASAAPGSTHALGAGRVVDGPFAAATLEPLGIAPDLLAAPNPGVADDGKDGPASRPSLETAFPGGIAWTHRRGAAWDLYFISNQRPQARELTFSLRGCGRRPECWDPVSGDRSPAASWRVAGDRTEVDLRLPPYGSVFLVLRQPAVGGGTQSGRDGAPARPQPPATAAVDPDTSPGRPSPSYRLLEGPWRVAFDPAFGGPASPAAFARLGSWTDRPEPGIRSYSGTASYTTTFAWRPAGDGRRVWLDLGAVADVARVELNGVRCGVAWTPPYLVEATPALRPGVNTLRIEVANTWFNRLAADRDLPPGRRITWTIAPRPPPEAAPRPAGLLGPVALRSEPAAGASVDAPAAVSAEDMERVYREAKTPFKVGVVLRPGPGESFDCPTVFRYQDHWYMLFVSIRDKTGYQTRLARSDDLLRWTLLGAVLPFSGSGWDRWQADGGAALVDPAWGGSCSLQSWDGRYWLSYLGGAKQGYEPDPLSIGLAWTHHPDRAEPWNRLPGNPILSPADPDARAWEQATLYKSTIIRDPGGTLGYPFVMFYNAKQKGPWIERIGIAVSRDMTHWLRFGADPVIGNVNPKGKGISGDPQIVRMGDLWVMFFFGAGWGRAWAFDTFACSHDLVHWTQWTGPALIAPSEPWDATFAHKPWLLKSGGVVYHFYCSVDPTTRAIALATSRDLR